MTTPDLVVYRRWAVLFGSLLPLSTVLYLALSDHGHKPLGLIGALMAGFLVSWVLPTEAQPPGATQSAGRGRHGKRGAGAVPQMVRVVLSLTLAALLTAFLPDSYALDVASLLVIVCCVWFLTSAARGYLRIVRARSRTPA